jgi:HPt (histidine-containing phosphotransfer) domain-containing protein
LAHELATEHPEQVQTSLKLADTLNLRRNEAIQNVLGVSAQGLKTLFRQVREALAERGERLVLLLEDITSWEGLDDSLIDVLVFNAAAKGDHDAREVCPLISVVGVTPTYYEKLAGNYRQRITHEVRLGHSAGGLQDVATLRERDARRKFAARYLAAARVGPVALAGWLTSVRSGEDAPPPNRCDTCPRQSACFDVFGNEDGIGLFPLTPHAFDRFFEALKENDNGQTWKTPRGILQAILNPNLSQPDSLAAGVYPGALVEPDVFRPDRLSNLALSNRLAQIVVNRIDAPQEQARMRRVLSYWADPERADTTVIDGHVAFAGTRRAVFEAFGLPWIGADEAIKDVAGRALTIVLPEPILPEPAEDDPDEDTGGPASSQSRPFTSSRPVVTPPKPKRLTQTKSQLEQLREQLRNWIATGTIDNPSRWNELLHGLVASVDARKLRVPSALVNRIITPEMVKMRGSTSGARDYLMIEAEPWVRNGLEAYIALRQDTGMTVADAAFHRRNLATMMRQLERSAGAYLDRRIPQMADGARWSPVATFAQILLARAWLRGVVASDAPIPDQIRVALEDEALSEGDFSARSAPWQDWLNATSKLHERLRTELRSMVGLAIGDGEGGAPLTDASELAGAVVRLRETGKFDPVPETDGALPEPFRRARELAELWRDRRMLMERTETSQITNRSQTLSELLRNKSVATHLDRLDRCITGIATLLPQAAGDRVIAWRQAYGRLKSKLEEGAGRRVEDLICAIEAEEIPVQLPLRLSWLARAPARDLEDHQGRDCRSTDIDGDRMSDVLVEAEALLTELPDAVARRKLGERLSKAIVALRTADHQIARMAALLDFSRIVEFDKTADQRAALQEMKECATDIGASLEEQLRLAVYEYENSLPKALAALERAVRERWRVVAADRFQPLIGIGELLTSMNVSNHLGDRLADCGRKGLASIANVGPITILLDTVRALLADLDLLQDERAAEIRDDEVGDFINALAERRATLVMVTPKVHDWLKEHRALERLGVSPR